MCGIAGLIPTLRASHASALDATRRMVTRIHTRRPDAEGDVTVQQENRPIILTLTRYYLPGHKSGGPVRSIANMADHVGDEFDFRIVTSDRDRLDEAPYTGMAIDSWNTVGKAQVYYLSPTNQSIRALARLISGIPYDVLYLNSFLDPVFTLQPLLARRLGLLPAKPVVIAPRGEFSHGALLLKYWKKACYKRVASSVGLYRELTWQASTEYEAKDIRRIQGRVAKRVVIAPDLSPTRGQYFLDTHSIRRAGEPLRVLFLSRVTPMKNLDFVLRTLTQVQTPVALSIVGPIENQAYWLRCQNLIIQLPRHVSASYQGHAEPSQVPEIMAGHDLFFLPTRGENYGHVIAEALSAGTPVLIADTTPWRNLEKEGAGWDLPLASEAEFAKRIDDCSRMTVECYQKLRGRAREFARKRLNDPALVEANRRLFMDLVEGVRTLSK
jgi:glycosyltransferase involved in cell wall biosynthesis